MKKRYGLPYQGSKNRLADQIGKQIIDYCKIHQIKKVYDIFGGGGCITHYLLDNSNLEVVYNDIDPNTVFKITQKQDFYKWCSYDDFKNADPIAKSIFSFGRYGKSYFCSKNKEQAYKDAFDYVVDNIQSPLLTSMGVDYTLSTKDDRYSSFMKHRNPLFSKAVNAKNKKSEARLPCYVNARDFDEFKPSRKFTVLNDDYRNIQFDTNSLIYADPPYNGTSGYNNPFDSEAFFDWAELLPVPIMISELSARPSFKEIWSKHLTCWGSQTHSKLSSRTEKLFLKE